MVCPLCTVAVAAGVGILEEWGVDGIIIGMWLGALIVSSICWMIDYLNRKNIHFLFRKIIIIVSFYAIFIIPLYFIKIRGATVLGDPGNIIFGMDRILFGVILGTIIFILAILSDKYLRTLNESKVLINYQKIFIPIIYLIIASIIAYMLIKITALS
jgi:hypothetical protein